MTQHYYHHLFISNHYKIAPVNIFQTKSHRTLLKVQVKDYVAQYALVHSRPWTVEDYLRILGSIHDLMDLVTNPFSRAFLVESRGCSCEVYANVGQCDSSDKQFVWIRTLVELEP